MVSTLEELQLERPITVRKLIKKNNIVSSIKPKCSLSLMFLKKVLQVLRHSPRKNEQFPSLWPS